MRSRRSRKRNSGLGSDFRYQNLEQRRLLAADVAVYEPSLDPAISAIATAFVQFDPQDANDSYDILTGWKATVDEFVSLGINEITFAVFRQVNQGVLSGGPTQQTVRSAVDYANENGLSVTILPLFETDQGWRGNYDPTGQTRATFQSNYSQWIADLASIPGIDRFNIGSELNRMVENSANLEFFARLIETARDNLDAAGNATARIGYAANFDIFSSQNHRNLLTQPGLEFFGVSAYNQLVGPERAFLISGTGEVSDETFQLLVDQWNNELDRITNFAASIDLPLIIQEFGAVQRNYATVAPFAVTPGDFVDSSNPDRSADDPLEQKAAYESLITALNGRGDQIESVTFWTWEHQASRGRRTFDRLGTTGVFERFAIWPTDGGGGEFLAGFLATEETSAPPDPDQTPVFAAIVDRQLEVEGTVGDDSIAVVENDDSVQVTVNGRSLTFAISEFDQVVVQAYAGNDEVQRSGLGIVGVTQYGGAGDDVLIGGDGDDVLIGGLGNDQLFANAGDDQLRGGDGDDLLVGHDGDDSLDGGSGRDRLFGHQGNDQLAGGTNDDEIVGGAGNDFILGGRGNDRLTGSLGDDIIRGEDGNDTIFGSAGLNTIRGGAGDDVVYGGNEADQIFGDAGIDQLFGLGGDDYIDAGDGGIAFTPGVAQADLVLGLSGNDTIVGGNGLNVLWGGDGDDHIIGGQNAENRLHGQSGNDELTGGDLQDFINVGGGLDVVNAGAGADFIVAGDGDDQIDGGDGVDSLLLTGTRQSYRVYQGSADDVLNVRDLRRQFSQGDNATTNVETLGYADGSAEAAVSAVRRVIVRPIVVSDDDGSNTANFFGDAATETEIKNLIDDIYAQGNVDLQWQSAVTYRSSYANVGDAADQVRLSSDLAAVVEAGDLAGVGSDDENVIDLYFVRRSIGDGPFTEQDVNGAALLGRSGAVVQVGDSLLVSTAGRRLIAGVVARELGQNLGLATNIVAPANVSYRQPSASALPRTGDDFLTAQQIETIFDSSLSRPV